MKGITIGLIAAAFGVGIGLGYLMAGDGKTSSRTGRTVVERPAAASAPMSAGEMQSLRGMLERIPIDPVPRASGTITGTVKTRDGEPLAGLLVVATPNAQGSRRKRSQARTAPVEPDLVEMVEASVKRVRWRQRAKREARTDEVGAFTIEGVGEGQYRVAAYAKGYRVTSDGAKAGGSVTLIANPIIRVDVDLAVEGGGTPERAHIVVLSRRGSARSSHQERWTREDPWIEVAPGRYELTAKLDGDIGGKSETQHVTFEEGEEALPMRFTIKMMPALRVTVMRAPMLTTAQLVGWIMPWKRETFPSAEQLRSHNKQQWAHGSKSRMLWKELKPGRYCVGVAYGWQGKPEMRFVELGGGLHEETIELPEPTGAGFLKVRLLDPEGKPVHAAQWMYYRSNKGGSSSSGINPLQRTDGVLLMPIGEEEQFKDGKHRLEAKHAVYGTLSRNFDPASAEFLDLQYEPACQPVGSIRGYADSEYQGRVRFQWHEVGKEPSHVWFHGEAPVDADGTMRLTPQQPGSRVLALYVQSTNHSWMRIAEREINLRPGRQDVSMDMPALHRLRIVWGAEPKKQTFSLRPDRKGGKHHHFSSFQAKSDANGIAVIDGVPAGRYKLQKYGRGLKDNPVVEIPETSEIRLP